MERAIEKNEILKHYENNQIGAGERNADYEGAKEIEEL